MVSPAPPPTAFCGFETATELFIKFNNALLILGLLNVFKVLI
jgi:hypothetical protein